MMFLRRVYNYFTGDISFLKDNLLLFSSITALNFLSYLYHFVIGRSLGPADYGVFGTLFSLIYFLIVPFNTIQTTFSHFVSGLRSEGKFGEISYLLKRGFLRMLLYASITVILFFIIIPFLQDFLKIPSFLPFLALSSVVFFSFFLPVTRGALQGLLNFKALGVNYVLEGVSKLILVLIFLSAGLGVSGAFFAFTASYIFPFLVSFPAFRFLFKLKKIPTSTRSIYRYSLPVFLMLFSLTAFYTIDVLLVKHYFDSVDAGFYSALAILGKVIFFGSISISLVMFPKVSALQNSSRLSRPILFRSLILIGIFGFGVTFFYFLFPSFVVRLFFGEAFLRITPILGFFGLFMTFFSLVYVLSFYRISLHRYRFLLILIPFNLAEVVLLVSFHQSLSQIVYLLTSFTALLFLVLFIITLIRK